MSVTELDAQGGDRGRLCLLRRGWERFRREVGGGGEEGHVWVGRRRAPGRSTPAAGAARSVSRRRSGTARPGGSSTVRSSIPASPAARWSGIADPLGSPRSASSAADDRGSGSGHGERRVGRVGGQAARRVAARGAAPRSTVGRPGPRRPGRRSPAGSPSPAAMASAERPRRAPRCARPARVGSASSRGSRHRGWPSVRQLTPTCQRGSGSPGYHLPWLCCDQRPRREPARRGGSPSAVASGRLVGPSAAMFHSAAST